MASDMQHPQEPGGTIIGRVDLFEGDGGGHHPGARDGGQPPGGGHPDHVGMGEVFGEVTVEFGHGVEDRAAADGPGDVVGAVVVGRLVADGDVETVEESAHHIDVEGAAVECGDDGVGVAAEMLGERAGVGAHVHDHGPVGGHVVEEVAGEPSRGRGRPPSLRTVRFSSDRLYKDRLRRAGIESGDVGPWTGRDTEPDPAGLCPTGPAAEILEPWAGEQAAGGTGLGEVETKLAVDCVLVGVVNLEVVGVADVVGVDGGQHVGNGQTQPPVRGGHPVQLGQRWDKRRPRQHLEGVVRNGVGEPAVFEGEAVADVPDVVLTMVGYIAADPPAGR